MRLINEKKNYISKESHFLCLLKNLHRNKSSEKLRSHTQQFFVKNFKWKGCLKNRNKKSKKILIRIC